MTTAGIKLRKLSRSESKGLLWGLFFISPWLLGFLGFTLYPLIASGYYSLTRYDLIREPVFLGFKNYINLFTNDPHFWNVMYNTLFYVGFSVPLGIGAAFLIATLLNSKIVGRSFFRGIIYIPSIVPAVCSAMVWLFLLNIQYGAINAIITSLGFQAIPFLSNPTLAKPSLVVVSMWTQGAAVVIFLAALQDVPRSLYEAATVDGANAWQKFRNVTIPMTTPVILFNLIMGFIGAFQEFTVPWLLTQGGPMNSTEFFAIHLYRNAFIYLRMGKASALAWIMFSIIVVFTLILFRTSARWVYYGGEE
ncbi:MAG TPA: spermidine/putrescine ABC transporter permease [Chloroflexi bacterium]|nr:spermidine/putrescine ABC transporter permease [Chloroflexota bacterium]HBY08605.1 spermidine/putrescine ABC transporter permease [Chloroflexota bacterium]